jgi:hypothetical protein
MTDTILIPAGVDGSRDNQGFLMNRQKDTNALNLTGGEYVDCGDDDVFTFVNGGFSLECWFRMDEVPSDKAYLIAKTSVDAAENSNDAEYAIYMGNAAKIYFRVQDDSESAYIGAYYNTALTLGRWYHLVCTHTEGGTTSATCKIYLGGSEVDDVDSNTVATYVAMENTTTPVIIGARADATHLVPFNGSIDDVRIYSKELSAPEVKRNYNAGKRSHR